MTWQPATRCVLGRVGAILLLLAIVACTPDSLHPVEIGGFDVLSPALTADLQSARWILQSYGPADEPVKVLEEPIVTAEFTDDLKLRGMAGCNTYATNVVSDGETITLGDLRKTPFGCPDELAWKQETSFLEALNSVEAISIEGDALAITYGSGKLLFARESSRPAVSLAGRLWRLLAFEKDHTILPPVSGTMITAEFASGRIMGLTGCNSYSGAYVQARRKITILETVVTVENCAGEGVMAQEAAYLTALRSAESVTSDKDILMINYEDGALIFTASGIAAEAPGTEYQTRNLR